MGATHDVVDVRETIERARDAITVRRVFGKAYDKDGVTVIPAARVQGGAGGGGGQGPGGEGSGSGSGFAVNAKPVGAYVIKDGDVRWRPAVDVNRVILGGQILMAGAMFVAFRLLRSRSRR